MATNSITGSKDPGLNFADIYNDEGQTKIKIGFNAGLTNQAANSVAVGFNAGKVTQGANAVAIGDSAGEERQRQEAVAIGSLAGRVDQQQYAVSVGHAAGASQQGANAIAVGGSAGAAAQGSFAIAIGDRAGQTSQKINAIAIGAGSANFNQGSNSIAIGAQAGKTNQAPNSIVFNATGTELNNIVVSSTVIKPIRADVVNSHILSYNDATGEIIKNTIVQALDTFSPFTNVANNRITLGQTFNATQAVNSIIINATGTAIANGVASSTVIKPIRADAVNSHILSYNDTSGEIFKTNVGQVRGALYPDLKIEANDKINIGRLITDTFLNTVVLNASGTTVTTTQSSSLYIKPIRADAVNSHILSYNDTTGEIIKSTTAQVQTAVSSAIKYIEIYNMLPQTLLGTTLNQTVLFRLNGTTDIPIVENSPPPFTITNNIFTFTNTCIFTVSYSILLVSLAPTIVVLSSIIMTPESSIQSIVPKQVTCGPVIDHGATNTLNLGSSYTYKVNSGSTMKIVLDTINGTVGTNCGLLFANDARISFVFHKII